MVGRLSNAAVGPWVAWRWSGVVSRLLVCLWGNLILLPAGFSQEATPPAPGTIRPWESLYAGPEATGQHVIGLWQFLPGQETQDNSGHGHELVLRGKSRFVPGGKFGNCLESFAVDRQEDRPVGAVVKNSPALSPPGAFTIEMWIRPKPEIQEVTQAFLVDKKYYHYESPLPQANRDYGWYLRREGRGGFRMVAGLGFGNDSAVYESQVFSLTPDRWYHLAFAYDGKGTGRFFVDGQLIGRVSYPGRGPVVPGPHNLVIGDRVGSIHVGFPGFIDQVRIVHGTPAFLPAVSVDLAALSRRVWVREEPNGRLTLLVANDSGKELDKVRLRAQFPLGVAEVTLGKLSAGEAKSVELPFDTRLRPDRYVVKVELDAEEKAAGGGGTAKELRTEKDLTVTIVPRPLPDRMPVIMWGTGPVAQVREIGFSHQIIGLVDYRRIWEAGGATSPLSEARLQAAWSQLDEHLAAGLGVVASLSPGAWVLQQEKLREQFQRVDRQGKPYSTADICGLFPEIESFVYNVGASVGKAFADHPAFQAVLIHTEVRDHTNLCFHDHDLKAYREATGQEIPPEIVSKWGLRYSSIKDFPADRVIADDDRIVRFYRWFWKEGDGWNRLHSALHRGLKETAGLRVWTWFDPAVRVPSLWGSGGSVDVLSQWTYTYPDPIKIGQATDELFAMAEGTGQQVMKMTQIIWYRSQTAPVVPEDPEKRAEWENRLPDAKFITIAPDHLREALWVKLSRPIRGIMYHGWGSLVDAGPGAYQYTNPETKDVLAQLIRKVVEPLGPTLLHLADPPADVALLESFTSQMLAGRGTYGWGQSWEADVHLILQWARLQPKIVYEETILRDGLDGYRVLVLPGCDVLPRSVVQRIRSFQAAGGIVIGDENLCPAIKPDYVLNVYKRTQKADVDKRTLQQAAEKLRQWLADKYRWPVDSSEPDAIVRRRVAGQAQYVFVINDRRTFGNYVGHHGRVMEKGLPLAAIVRLQNAGQAVYDLVAGKPMPAKVIGTETSWEVELGPGEGKLFMVLPQAIKNVRIGGPTVAQPGSKLPLLIEVVGQTGTCVDAVIPVKVELVDPSGRLADASGYYAAKAGRLEVVYPFAVNDEPGRWTIRATELASGQMAEAVFELKE